MSYLKQSKSYIIIHWVYISFDKDHNIPFEGSYLLIIPYKVLRVRM